MIKEQPMKYQCAVVWGRMALPHFGHVELIQKGLDHGNYVDVHLSQHHQNNDYDIRVLLLKRLCAIKELDMTKVRFYHSPTIGEAMTFSIDMAPFKEVVLVLGTDQLAMGHSISQHFDTAFIENPRSTSSTETRYFLDRFRFREDLLFLYNGCEYAITLAQILRAEEKKRESLVTTTKKTKVIAKSYK